MKQELSVNRCPYLCGRIGKLSEKLTRSRRCEGGVAIHNVTGKPGRRTAMIMPKSEDLPAASDLHNGYEGWPCVRTE